MPLENHSLVKEFPEMREQIHQLKGSNTHFARLFSKYDSVQHAVHRIESGADAASDARLETLKKERLFLKDSLFEMLNNAAQA